MALDERGIPCDALPSMNRKQRTLYPHDFCPRSIKQMMPDQRALSSLLFCHLPRMDRKLCVGAWSFPFRQWSGVEDEDALDDLGQECVSDHIVRAREESAVYLCKRQQSARRDQHVRSYIQPLPKLQIGNVKRHPCRNATVGPCLR